MNMYWCNETDSIVTEDELKENYRNIYASEYETFPDYLSACMWYNNGALTDLYSHISKLKKDLNRFIDWYDAEEVKAIQDDINRLEKLYLET